MRQVDREFDTLRSVFDSVVSFANAHPNARRRAAVALSVWVAVAALAGCVSWQQTRTEVVDPIHELLHHTYPEALETTDRAQVIAVFTDGSPGIAPSLELMAQFQQIREARFAIGTIDLEQRPIPVVATLRVEGIDFDGTLSHCICFSG